MEYRKCIHACKNNVRSRAFRRGAKPFICRGQVNIILSMWQWPKLQIVSGSLGIAPRDRSLYRQTVIDTMAGCVMCNSDPALCLSPFACVNPPFASCDIQFNFHAENAWPCRSVRLPASGNEGYGGTSKRAEHKHRRAPEMDGSPKSLPVETVTTRCDS